jgi:cytochrome b subunit of formate dehydrogenase
VAVPPVRAQEPVADAVCRMCHADVSTPASSEGGEREPRIHADVACVDCHAALRSFDVAEMEHETPVAAASCTPCHQDVVGQVAHGAHAAAGVSCADCHGAHEPRSYSGADRALSFGRVAALCTRCHPEVAAAPPGDPHARAFRRRTCLACHDAHANRAPASRAGDAACLLCHAGDAATAKAPAPPAAVAASVHGAAGISCVLCHVDLQGAELPHEESLAPVSCAGCHPEASAAHANGVHAHVLAGGGLAAACTDCHGTHDVLSVDDPRSPVYALNVPATCEACHRPSPPAAHPAPAGEEVRLYDTSVHGRLLLEKGLLVSATCVSCHGSHEVRPTRDPEASTSRRHVPYTCGTCHAGVLAGYLAGVHGADFLTGGADVPVCTDCHSEHAIEDPARAASSVSATNVAATCARCHANDELARRYGIEGGRFASWGASYHGIAAGFGETRAANCASCHGYHAILPPSDPRSPVHPDNLQKTCGKCHAGAGAAFARVPVHSRIDRETNFVPWLVRRIYAVVVVATIGAFLLFILIDLFGRLRVRLGWGPRETEHVDPRAWPDEARLVGEGETFPRMGRVARAQHGLLIASFLLLVLTGLPVFLHQSAWMRSVIDLEGGFRLRSLLHRAAAVGLIGLSVWHLLTLALSGGARRWFAEVMIRPRDVRDFAQELGFDLGLGPWLARRHVLRRLFERWPALRCDRRPALGRYGLVEKLEYGAVLWGNLVMIATGAILWRPDWFLDWTPSWTFDVCRVVHGFEATLAFLAIIVWHMYHVHLRPGVFPMSRTWLTGRISREELRRHHPREYLRILQARREAERDDPPGA